jgi:flagellar biosynthetic protein FliP
MTHTAVNAQPAAVSESRLGKRVLRFAGHYLEMVLVMFAGMFVLGGILIGIAALAGVTWAELREDVPALVLLGMGASMVAPMVWWMRRRGHSTAANREMAAAMIVPTLVTVALLAFGAMTDIDALLEIEHMAMLPAMLVVMLLRRDEYSRPHRRDSGG